MKTPVSKAQVRNVQQLYKKAITNARAQRHFEVDLCVLPDISTGYRINTRNILKYNDFILPNTAIYPARFSTDLHHQALISWR